MSFSEPLPENIEIGENVRACASADMLPDGTFGQEWLIVTEERLLVYTAGPSGPVPRMALLLSEIDSPKAESMIGSSILEVGHDGKTIEVVRYTNSRSRRFGAIIKALGKWIKGDETEIEEPEAEECPRCGLPLPKGSKVCPACGSKRKTLVRLFAYLLPYWPVAVVLSLISCVSTALSLVPPYLQKPLINQVFMQAGGMAFADRRRLLILLVAVLVGSFLVRSGMGIFQGWMHAWLGNHISHDIRTELYQHLHLLSLRYYDQRKIGTVISRVNQDTGGLQHFLIGGAQDLAINFLLFVGIGGMLFWMNWKLALLVIVPAPLVGLLSVSFFKLIRKYMGRFFHRWGKLNALMNESLSGVRVVKAFAQEMREVERFDTKSEDLAAAGIKAERAWVLLFSGISLLMMSGTFLVWFFGGLDVLNSKMDLGTLMAYLAYVGMFYRPIQSMSMLINWSSRALTAAERIFEVLNAQPDVKEDPEAVPMPEMTGKVEFRDVTFGYAESSPVLKHFSLEVPPGEMIGLVGHSGAGKTTTINLLCRFYDVDQGEICIDGVPIRKIRLQDLRSQIGIVLQNTLLFSGTIAENISYAKPTATREEIIRAAKIANAHDFILRKPDGYETVVGERGQGLSAGELQRVAIARAVLHNPKILILDEATSQVDVETERNIQEAISRLVEGRTTFAIAHRLSTLKDADRLVVLKQGEIAQIGSHAELLAQDGEFKRLVTMYQEVSRVRAVER